LKNLLFILILGLTACSSVEPYGKPKITLQKDVLNGGDPRLITAIEIGATIK